MEPGEISKSLYQMMDGGWGVYPTEKITIEYMEDGARCVSEFDQEGNQISHTCCGPDGEILPEHEEQPAAPQRGRHRANYFAKCRFCTDDKVAER